MVVGVVDAFVVGGVGGIWYGDVCYCDGVIVDYIAGVCVVGDGGVVSGGADAGCDEDGAVVVVDYVAVVIMVGDVGMCCCDVGCCVVDGCVDSVGIYASVGVDGWCCWRYGCWCC